MADLLNTRELAAAMHVTRKAVSDWIKRGLPHTAQGKTNRFDLAEVQKWHAEHVEGSAGLKDKLLTEKIEHEQAKKALTQLQLAEKRKQLVDRREVERENHAKFRAIRNRFLALANLGTLLEGKNAAEMHEVLKAEIERILTELAT